MNYMEFGKNNTQVIMLLHGGGMSSWNYKEVASYLEGDYHVIVPFLDGHAGSDYNFTTIKDNALRLIEFINQNYNGHIEVIGGLSLGGQILLEMLSLKKDVCKIAFVESALVVPSKMIHDMIRPSLHLSFGLIQYRWFSKLQFNEYRLKPELFEDYYKDTCAISKENMIAFLKENAMYSLKESLKDTSIKVYVFVGDKENKTMKKSAQMIHDCIKNSQLMILPHMYHGQFSMNHAKEYADMMKDIINKNI